MVPNITPQDVVVNYKVVISQVFRRLNIVSYSAGV
jgi:hypothetical protein